MTDEEQGLVRPETLFSFDTEYSADSCEYNPELGILATGTYQVNKLNPESESPETEKLGRIYLHKLTHTPNPDSQPESPVGLDSHLVSRLESPAVLDMKWSMREPVLGVVNAKGQLVIYKYTPEEQTASMLSSTDISEGLALALEWNIYYDRIIVSDSKGKVRVLNYTDSEPVVINEYSEHGYESWTCCFSARDPNLVFSGGDDCSLNCYDLRTDGLVHKNSKIHSMGVTAMISDREKEHQLITGSYDEWLRRWDERNLKREVDSIQVGGGVWRIKQRGQRFLVAAMHGGYLVLDNMDIIARYKHGEESLSYGADWINDTTAASCSFYDHVLKLWRFS
ncbi:diphthine methyltransferase homolog [Eurytemora carolleeae]|uniref:diphthine methyltransferase homolog n=1 Tax=Eurytemora carolleeae TaxID=1294199 RepID=UPI000C790E34|nr:diphthine methyltransferase homolog [Eurytemora carolleeae]|eukprot:XP_023342445.1 diphthine methyltransferase homolog [Eurytemora affinis]